MNSDNRVLQHIEPELPQTPREEILIANLQYLMKKEGLSEAELARRTKLPQPTLHKILSGTTEDPRISTLQILSNYFGITIDALFSVLPESEKVKAINVKPIPIISWEDCVRSANPTTHLSSSNHSDWVVVERMNHDGAYALMSKASMAPEFPKGTLFIVNPNVRPSDGDLVIVHYPNTQEATLRELSIDGPRRLLLSINNDSGSDSLTEEIKILATVEQSRFEHR